MWRKIQELRFHQMLTGKTISSAKGLECRFCPTCISDISFNKIINWWQRDGWVDTFHRANCRGWWCMGNSRLTLERFSVRILARTPIIPTWGFFHDYPQSVQENFVVALLLGCDWFFPNPSHLVTHQSLYHSMPHSLHTDTDLCKSIYNFKILTKFSLYLIKHYAMNT
jgi:putative component of membrane protein insertase Oxa1/YidC/SpoIIIJ protein YidD